MQGLRVWALTYGVSIYLRLYNAVRSMEVPYYEYDKYVQSTNAIHKNKRIKIAKKK